MISTSKRQWEHRLGKWEMKKYKGNSERPPNQPDSSPASSISTDYNPRDRPTPPTRATDTQKPPPARSTRKTADTQKQKDDAEVRYDYEDVTSRRDSSLAPTFTPKRPKPAGSGPSQRLAAAQELFAY